MCNKIASWWDKIVGKQLTAPVDTEEARWEAYQEQLVELHYLPVARLCVNETADVVTAKMYLELISTGLIVGARIELVELPGKVAKRYYLQMKRKDQVTVDKILHVYGVRTVWQ